MDIDWMALVKVALVSFAFGVGIVTVFSVGILGVAAGGPKNGTVGGPTDGQTAPAGRVAGIALSTVCFAACAAAVLYGLWLIIPQFH